jgi:hypothetical protein
MARYHHHSTQLDWDETTPESRTGDMLLRDGGVGNPPCLSARQQPAAALADPTHTIGDRIYNLNFLCTVDLWLKTAPALRLIYFGEASTARDLQRALSSGLNSSPSAINAMPIPLVFGLHRRDFQ